MVQLTSRRPFPRYRHLQAEFVRRGLIQADVARRVGIHPTYFSAVLTGQRRMSERLARDISRATGIPLAVILPGDGDREGA